MKNDKLFKSVRALTVSALMTAMSVVIGIFCKSLLNFGDGLFRISLEGLPIILSGITLGPVIGGAVGIASDVISYLLSPQTYPINIIVTIGAGVIGVVSGAVSKYLVRGKGKLRLVISTAAAHLFGSVIIKSVGLFSFYGWGVLFRIPTYALIVAIESLILCLLYERESFRRLIEGIRKENL